MHLEKAKFNMMVELQIDVPAAVAAEKKMAILRAASRLLYYNDR
jgi:hypothetical protein